RFMVRTAGLNSDAHIFMASIQANVSATLWDPSTLHDTCSPSGSIRVHPASGDAAMLPLTLANNNHLEMLFFGGRGMSNYG
ncbi:hypothetical protein BJ322DRAFT_1000278, partial [Thelephora terrestris]